MHGICESMWGEIVFWKEGSHGELKERIGRWNLVLGKVKYYCSRKVKSYFARKAKSYLLGQRSLIVLGK